MVFAVGELFQQSLLRITVFIQPVQKLIREQTVEKNVNKAVGRTKGGINTKIYTSETH